MRRERFEGFVKDFSSSDVKVKLKMVRWREWRERKCLRVSGSNKLLLVSLSKALQGETVIWVSF